MKVLIFINIGTETGFFWVLCNSVSTPGYNSLSGSDGRRTMCTEPTLGTAGVENASKFLVLEREPTFQSPTWPSALDEKTRSAHFLIHNLLLLNY